jgi:hypothetical protein
MKWLILAVIALGILPFATAAYLISALQFA